MRPFPRPLGRDGKLPLLSSCADSFHAVNGHRGTVLRDNFFVNAGDALRPAAALGEQHYACMLGEPMWGTVMQGTTMLAARWNRTEYCRYWCLSWGHPSWC